MSLRRESNRETGTNGVKNHPKPHHFHHLQRNKQGQNTPRSLLCAAVISLLVWGCSGPQSVPPPPPAGQAQITLLMTDTPPAGFTLLNFELAITGAVLVPTSGSNVSLIDASNPVQVEIRRLQAQNTFLKTVTVPEGDYTELRLTFANAQMTVRNDSAQSLVVNGSSCDPGLICELQPTISPASVTLSGSTLVLEDGDARGLLIDFNLNAAVQSTLNVNPSSAVSVSFLDPLIPSHTLAQADDLFGTVTAKSTAGNTFTLQTANGTQVIAVDSDTTFAQFGDAIPPAANTFSGVAVGQVLLVDAFVLDSGVLRASRVEFKSNTPDEQEVRGIIAALGAGSPPSQFTMVVLDVAPAVTEFQRGDVVIVQMLGGSLFRVDGESLSVPSDLVTAFDGPDDLLVGQTVEVSRMPGSALRNVVTDVVRLQMTSLTATVAATPSGNNFNVSGLAALFTQQPIPITQIRVRTLAGTSFEGVTNGIQGIQQGNIVTVGGLLFRTAGNPDFVAQLVRKR